MGKSWQAQSSTILANFNPGSNLRRVEALLNRTVTIEDAYRRGHFGLPLRLQPEIRQVAPGGKSSSDESHSVGFPRTGLGFLQNYNSWVFSVSPKKNPMMHSDVRWLFSRHFHQKWVAVNIWKSRFKWKVLRSSRLGMLLKDTYRQVVDLGSESRTFCSGVKHAC